MARVSKQITFLRIAYVLAQRSTCVRRGVGAVLTDALGHVLATGYNGVAAGLPHCLDHPCAGARHPSGSGLEVCEAIHAEQNALMQCPDTQAIQAIFVTTSPCMHCMKMLLNTSCQEIHFLGLPYDTKATALWEKAKRKFYIYGEAELGLTLEA